jgi:hypothetical protein
LWGSSATVTVTRTVGHPPATGCVLYPLTSGPPNAEGHLTGPTAPISAHSSRSHALRGAGAGAAASPKPATTPRGSVSYGAPKISTRLVSSSLLSLLPKRRGGDEGKPRARRDRGRRRRTPRARRRWLAPGPSEVSAPPLPPTTGARNWGSGSAVRGAP